MSGGLTERIPKIVRDVDASQIGMVPMGSHPYEFWNIYAVYDLTRNRSPLGAIVANSLEEAIALALKLHNKDAGQLEVIDTGRKKRKKCCGK